jgi:adenine-specific DNA-methyltransferase
MPGPAVTIDTCALYQGDALAILPTLPPASVQLLLCDPPYFKTKMDYLGERLTWDRQWPTREAYLAWLRQLAKEWQRVLTPAGSLYCFASPQMAAYVEVLLGEGFEVLNHIVWVKHDGTGAGTGGHSKVCKEELRAFFPQSERILFCEQVGHDARAAAEAGYHAAERQLKTSLFSVPIAEAMTGTQATAKQVTEAIGAYGRVNHGGAVSNWLQGYNIPTKAQYEAMRRYFNERAKDAACDTISRQEYTYLRQEYEALRQEYEALRQEYEALRRPFTVSASVPFTDVWADFPTVPAAPGKHPCEKPMALLRHIILTSSRPGETVLDCCAGSFATLDAARECGRKGIGIEQDPHWVKRGIARLSQQYFPFATAHAAPVPPRLTSDAQRLFL